MPDIPDRDELEKKIARLLGKLNAKQRAELLELLGNSPSMARIPPSFWTTSQQELATELMPFSEDVYLAAANRVLESVPIGIDWALINQDAANWARSYSVHLAGQINETSRSAVATSIRNSVASFFEEGLTIGELENRLASDPELQKLFTRDIKDRLGRVYGPARAEMIAVTETTRAAAQGEIGVANRLKAEGIEMRKVWQTNKDELVCPICSPLQGVEEREWSATAPDGPPAHPRCRCFLSLLLPKPAGVEEPTEELEYSGDQIKPVQPMTDKELRESGIMDNLADWYYETDEKTGSYLLTWDKGVQGQKKYEIAMELSKRTGIEYDKINEMLRTWAQSSNDDNIQSLHLQERASKLFGVKPTTWQQERINNYTFSNVSHFTDDEVDTFLKAMYKHTQEELQKAGIDSLRLVRGVRVTDNELLEIAKSTQKGGNIVIDSNVMESWSFSRDTANDFGNIILEAEIPANRIISTAKTGMGCLDEFEFIVIGSDAEEIGSLNNLVSTMEEIFQWSHPPKVIIPG